jgi:hypothetical protein
MGAAVPVPAPLVPATVYDTVVALSLVTLQVAVVSPRHAPPVQTKLVGWLLQLALIVVDCPGAGAAGLAVGAQPGVPPPPAVTQVTVCASGVPETTRPEQAGLL